jgi:hypothetical protein
MELASSERATGIPGHEVVRDQGLGNATIVGTHGMRVDVTDGRWTKYEMSPSNFGRP